VAGLADLGVREAEPDGKAKRVGDHPDHEKQAAPAAAPKRPVA